MPVELMETDGGRGVVIVGRGTVTTEEYLSVHVPHVGDLRAISRYLYSLSDYTRVDRVEVGSEAVRDIAHLCQAAYEANPGLLVALCATEDRAFGLSRMWEAFLGSPSWETMAFRTRPPAEEWLRARLADGSNAPELAFR